MSARDDDPTIAGLRLAEKRLRAEELHYPADSVASAITRLESQNRDNARVARSCDDLADLIDEFSDFEIYETAYMILKAGWRTPARVIETVEELESLVDETVIRDQVGDVFEALPNIDLRTDFWRGDEAFQPSSVRLPAVVLWEPGDGDE